MNPKFTITNAITKALTTIERARGFLDAATLSEEWVQHMAARALLLEAHYTTHIEGSQLTLEQSERLLAGQSAPEADPDDARELLNYRRAFDFVDEYVAEGHPVTEGLIREIHKRLVEGVRGGGAQPGAYRTVQNYVVNSQTGKAVYTPPPAYDVPILMRELVKWINQPQDIHPVLVSGIAQFQLVHIHPFLDGNGRTSRLLSTLCLYQQGYDFKRLFTISEYYDRDRPAFYRAIQSVRDNDMDMTGWIEFFTSGLSTQMREVTEKGERAIRRDVLVRKHSLNERQATAVGFMLEQGKLHLKDYERMIADVDPRTLQRDLKKMVELGILTVNGAARAAHYTLRAK